MIARVGRDGHVFELAGGRVGKVLSLCRAGFNLIAAGKADSLQPPPDAVRKVERLLRVLRWLKPDLDTEHRGRVIRCSCMKVGEVTERFPEALYPRYDYYDYWAYDKELAARFGGRRYWRSDVVACRESSDQNGERRDPEPIGAPGRN